MSDQCDYDDADMSFGYKEKTYKNLRSCAEELGCTRAKDIITTVGGTVLAKLIEQSDHTYSSEYKYQVNAINEAVKQQTGMNYLLFKCASRCDLDNNLDTTPLS